MKRRVGILISGRGSNMMALIEAARAPHYPAHIALVISNRSDAPGLALARAAHVAALVIDHRDFATREAFDHAVEAALEREGVELVCHAGFMRIQSDAFATRWLGRQLNIHPSLLPSFPGLNPHKQALEAGVRISGCTVHFVTPAVDCGPIVAQAAVPVVPGDTPGSLAARILKVEHRLYPFALKLAASGQVRLEEKGVSLMASFNQSDCLFSPNPGTA
jgi:phosphoribosylglycinamide formyltransferase-1